MVVMRDMIAPHLRGQNPLRISALESHLDLMVHGNLLARGAVNMALFDIAGKFHHLPAHLLLGGLYQEKLPLLGPIGSGTPDEDADAILKLIEDKYETIMIKMGALPIDDEINRMMAAHEKFSDRIKFIVDANQGWTVAETLRFMDGIGHKRPDLIEQPIDRHDIHGLQRIHRRAPCLLSADEGVASAREAAALIQARAVDAFSIKVSKNGGLSKAKKIAETADAFGLRILMNSMLEFGITQAASLQLGCVLPNLLDLGHAYMSVLRMADDITDFAGNISDSIVTVPSAPGLGVRLDEEKLNRYTLDYLKVD
jgi:muconate cycloisomerase